MVVLFHLKTVIGDTLIWSEDLTKCILQNHTSLRQTLKYLQGCGILKFCVKANHAGMHGIQHFYKTPCGHINIISTSELYEWHIVQHSGVVLLWNMYNFSIPHTGAGCPDAFIAWSSEEKQLQLCGYRLPWSEETKGNVILSQYIPKLYSAISFFAGFFQIKNSKRGGQFHPTHISYNLTPFLPFSHYYMSDGQNHDFYMMGRFALSQLIVNITMDQMNIGQSIYIFDGPSKIVPILFYNNNTNKDSKFLPCFRIRT